MTIRKICLRDKQHFDPSKMLVSLTVGKVDAGVAVLLTEDKRLVGTEVARLRSLPRYCAQESATV